MGLQPTVAVVIPAYNEGPTIVETLSACAAVEYPADKLDIVCVNDGSTDDTWALTCFRTVEQAGYRSGPVHRPPHKLRQANCAFTRRVLRRLALEILVFVDSDSAPAADGCPAASSKYSQTPTVGRGSRASRTCVTPDATCSPGCRLLATTSPMTY